MRRNSTSQTSIDSLGPSPAMFVKASQHSTRMAPSRGPLPALNTSLRNSSTSSGYRASGGERRSPTSPTRTRHDSLRPASGVHGTAQHVSSRSKPSSSRRSSTNWTDQRNGNPNSIPHLRNALNSLESQMANLMFERRMLERKLEKAVRLQSPIQRLPGELLGHVFFCGVHYCDPEDTILLSTLMLVCKEWAEVATNTPALWSQIVIENPASLAKARFKLQRSKEIPLDISIQFSPQFEHAQVVTETVLHAMDILKPAIWRWRSFRLAVPSRSQAQVALSQCKQPAPLLEVLSVQIHQFMQEDTQRFSQPPTGAIFQGHLPSLRSCSFTSFNFGWDVGLVSHLRVLRLGGYWNGFAPSVSTIISILRACPGLEELALRNMSDVEGAAGGCSSSDFHRQFDRKGDFDMGAASYAGPSYSPKSSEIVTMPRLRRASFYYSGVERMHALMSQLALPALERLEFAYLDNLTPILKYLKHQPMPLAHMRIESCFFNELKLLSLLERFSSLRTLEFVDVEDISANFLSGLSHPSPTSRLWICPKLESLNFDSCSTISWDALRSLVESRLPPTGSSSRMLGPVDATLARGNSLLASSASSYALRQKTQQFSSASSYSSSLSSFSSASALSSSSRASMSSTSTASSSASRYSSSSYQNASATSTSAGPPRRLKTIDLTRCHQITKEMIQWLRMYVSEVRCETVKTYWGEFGFAAQ